MSNTVKRNYIEDTTLRANNSKRPRKTPTTLLDLPAELRLQILESALARGAFPADGRCDGCRRPNNGHEFEVEIKLCVATHDSLKRLSTTIKHTPLQNEIDSLTRYLLISVMKDCIAIQTMIIQPYLKCGCDHCTTSCRRMSNRFASSFQLSGPRSLAYLTQACEFQHPAQTLSHLVGADADFFCYCSNVKSGRKGSDEDSDGGSDGNSEGFGHGDSDGNGDGDSIEAEGVQSDEDSA